MSGILLDRLSGSMFNVFSKTKAISPSVLTDFLPSAPTMTALAQRAVTNTYSIVTTDQISNRTKVEVLAVGGLLIPRLFTVGPVFGAVTILGFIVYKLGQFLAGKVSLQGILNFLNAVKKMSETTSKNETPRIEEVVEETPDTDTTAQAVNNTSQPIPQSPTKEEFSVENFTKFEDKENMVKEFESQNNNGSMPTEKKWSDQYVQAESTPVTESGWVKQFVTTTTSPQASVMVEQFIAGQALADEFVALDSNPALRRIQVIQSQTKTQEKTEKVKEQKTAEKQLISKENAKKLYLQFLAQQQAKRGKAKL